MIRGSAESYLYHLICPDVAGEAVLMAQTGDGWALPSFARAERYFWQDTGHVNDAAGQLLGLEATTLRCVTSNYEPAHEQVQRYYAMELHVPDGPPEGYRWVRRTELERLRFAGSQQRQVIEGWFAWDALPDKRRAPWYRRGWYREATAWINGWLERQGLEPAGPIRQLRSWQRAAILHVPGAGGDLYFKAVPPVFATEPRLVAALAQQQPERFPATVASDPARRWWLMRDAGSLTLNRLAEIERWEEAVRTFASTQIICTRQVESLLQLGCPDRRLERLTTQLGPLFADTEAMLPGRPAGLSAEQIRQLHALIPALKRLSGRLAGYRLPATIEHGDFWPGQIIVDNERTIFIDWSDSSVAHPFFSMLFFLVESEDYFPKLLDVGTRLRDAYLEPWTNFAPMRRLRDAFETAQPLAALHHALIYHQTLLPSFEIGWETQLMLPFYLKLLLKLAPPI